MKSIAGLQDTFTLSLVKGAAKRVRPKVPAAGEAWQGGEVASHEVHRAPGTLCHAGRKELGTCSTKKNDIIWEFFPTWVGGSSKIPKLKINTNKH